MSMSCLLITSVCDYHFIRDFKRPAGEGGKGNQVPFLR